MKLGVAWFGFRFLSPSNYFEMARAFGLPYVEIPLYPNVYWEWYRTQHDIEAIKEAAEEAGVKMVAGVTALDIAGEIHGNSIIQNGVELNTAQAHWAVDVGAELGIEVIRLAEPHRLEADQLDLAEPYLQAFGDAFCALGDYADERGVRVAIENFGLTSSQIVQVLDSADHSNVGTLYDPCNYYRHGEDPLTALKNLNQRVFYCHLKDAYFPYPARKLDSIPMVTRGQMYGQIEPWWWIRPLGEGNVEWGPILSELATFYKGYMCLEHDIDTSVVRGTRVGIEYVRRLAEEQGFEVQI